MTTLSDGTTTIDLGQMTWLDELTWAPVEQSATRTITGGLVLRVAARTGGRPITLASDADDKGWLLRSALQQCRSWAAVADPAFRLTLLLAGEAYTVVWRHQDGAIEAALVMPWHDPQPDDDYRATLRFMGV